MFIGWHFFSDGLKKFDPSGNFTSAYFLESSRGPMSDVFKGMISDRDGAVRLDQKATIDRWTKFKDQVVSQLGYDEEQKKQAEEILKAELEKLAWFHQVNDEDIAEYKLELDRLKKAKLDKNTRNVEYRREWIYAKDSELIGKRNGWLKTLSTQSDEFESQLAGLANENQVGGDWVPMPDPGAMPVDTIVKFTVLTVGILLLAGLFTRFAAIVGAGFLLSVIATQPPWVAGAADTTYQIVEFLALLVLAAMAAGRVGGLDYFLHTIRMKWFPPEKWSQA